MNKQYTIRADSLDVAMRRAKDLFGADAIVVDTRSSTRKNPKGMGIKSMVELTVEPGRTGFKKTIERSRAGDVDVYEETPIPSGSVLKVQREIDRIERLIHSIERAEAQLKSFNSRYPLNDLLLSSGVSDSSLRVLQSEYEDRVPAAMRNEPDAARMHLLDYLKCAKTESFGEISGPHVFLGSAGSGKTTLVIKLAAELVRTGRKVALVAVAPYHSGEVRRLEEAASALTIDAAVALEFSDLERALTRYEKADVILIDTPCMLSRKSAAVTELFEKIKPMDTIFKHYVCSLTNDSDFLSGELELYRAWNCDFLSIAKVDLARRCGKIVEIVLNQDVIFSFVSYEEDDGPGIQLAAPALLFNLVSPAMGEGSGGCTREGER